MVGIHYYFNECLCLLLRRFYSFNEVYNLLYTLESWQGAVIALNDI